MMLTIPKLVTILAKLYILSNVLTSDCIEKGPILYYREEWDKSKLTPIQCPCWN